MEVDTKRMWERVQRLDRLTRGLWREIQQVSLGDDPLLYRERKAYLAGLRGIVSGMEGARVALTGAIRRLEGPDG